MLLLFLIFSFPKLFSLKIVSEGQFGSKINLERRIVVDGKDIVDELETINATLLPHVASPEVQTFGVEFQGDWQHTSLTQYGKARWFKDAHGIVHLEGLVKGGVVDENIVILPQGYRPTTQHIFFTFCNGSGGEGFCRIVVYVDGRVNLSSSSSSGTFSMLSLSGITYLAA